MNGAGKPALRVVAPTQPVGCVEGPEYPLVPDGEYLAVYAGHNALSLAQFGRTPKLFLRVRLVDAGPHTDKVLFRAYRLKRLKNNGSFTVGPRSDLFKMFCRLLDSRLRPDRLSFHDLKHCLLRIRTRTVNMDGDRNTHPAVLRYSVVDEILSLETTCQTE